MTDSATGVSQPLDGVSVSDGSAKPASRTAIGLDLVWKVLAVLGVMLLVYIMIYLGTWLAMLN